MAQRMRPQQTATRVSQSTSVATVMQLLETGVSCISYLRGLFTEDNFEDHRLTAPRLPISANNPPSSSQLEEKNKGPTSVKVKKLTRGGSDEGDKLLDYVEMGAADAIEKGYLHQLMFAIYLDPDDPTNIVECYTFTFTYNTDPDGIKHPELVVRNQLNGLVLSSKTARAKKNSNAVELDDAKRQVQKLIKNLIVSTQAMDELPRRRFITIRMYYTPETPEEYEPPHFRAVNADESHFKITTGQIHEPPDIETLGSLSTGYHGLTLHMISIAPLLEVPYDETIPLLECTSRNVLDAETRRVVWDAEALVSAGGIDEEGRRREVEPLGIRVDGGEIRGVGEVEGKEWEGVRKMVGIEGGEERMVFAKEKEREERIGGSDNEALRNALERDMSIASGPATQIAPVISRLQSTRPPVPLFHDVANDVGPSQVVLESIQEDVDMDDSETVETNGTTRNAGHACATAFSVSSMNAFQAGSEEETQLLDETQRIVKPASKSKKAPTIQRTFSRTKTTSAQRGIWACSNGRKVAQACDCGDDADDGPMVNCGVCEVWKHLYCYGYTTSSDPLIPEDFTCYPCRVIISSSDALLNPEREVEIERILNQLRGLALFRRALQLSFDEGVFSAAALAERFVIDQGTAIQLLKRLKAEEFIIPGKPKGKSKKPGPLVVSKLAKSHKVKDSRYFAPGKGAETGLSSMLDCYEVDAMGEEDYSPESTPPDSRTSIAKMTPCASSPSTSIAIPSISKLNIVARTATTDDPIVDDSSDEAEPATLPVSKPAYVLTFPSKSRKLNHRLPSASTSASAFQRASSFQVPSSLPAGPIESSTMDVDQQTYVESDTYTFVDSVNPRSRNAEASTSETKRAHGEGETQVERGRKRGKCSEATQIEI